MATPSNTHAQTKRVLRNSLYGLAVFGALVGAFTLGNTGYNAAQDPSLLNILQTPTTHAEVPNDPAYYYNETSGGSCGSAAGDGSCSL